MYEVCHSSRKSSLSLALFSCGCKILKLLAPTKHYIAGLAMMTQNLQAKCNLSKPFSQYSKSFRLQKTYSFPRKDFCTDRGEW